MPLFVDELYPAINSRGLQVDVMAGGHGSTSTFAEFEALAIGR